MTLLEVDKQAMLLGPDRYKVWKVRTYVAQMHVRVPERTPYFVKFWQDRSRLAADYNAKINASWPWHVGRAPTEKEQVEIDRLEALCVKDLLEMDAAYEAALAAFDAERIADAQKILAEVAALTDAEVAKEVPAKWGHQLFAGP
jgi:hypothetical protein